MSLFTLKRGETERLAFSAPSSARSLRPERWLPGFERGHRSAIMALLVALLCAQAFGMVSAGIGGAVLLVGGALIGIPHGSSDFVVAFRAMAPRLGRLWLPCFLALYCAIVAAMMAGWRLAPTVTFVLFLAVSGFHFGMEDGGGEIEPWAFLARALTPILPIFLCHPTEVSGIIGLMSDTPHQTVAAMLDEARPIGLTLYAALLGCVAIGSLTDADGSDRRAERLKASLERVLLALAAVVLPALVTFAIYFCLIHALRHMAHLGDALHPRSARAALRLTALIVAPSALVCGLALVFAWSALAGVTATTPLLALALQITAALTVPHVLLEEWTRRQADAVPV